MGADQKFFVQGDDGAFRRLKEEYSVTVYFDTQKELDAFMILLEKINDLKMELPGQQEEENE